jgi:hypothetical protein
LTYFQWSYGDATELVLINGKVIGLSSTGVRQGDPLGPLFFSLGFMESLLQTKGAFPEISLLAYLDDCFFKGEIKLSLTA